MLYKNLILQFDNIFQLKYVLPTQSTMLFSRRKEKPHKKNNNKNRKQQKQRIMIFFPLTRNDIIYRYLYHRVRSGLRYILGKYFQVT